VQKPQPVVPMSRLGLAGETEAVERSIQPVSRTVAGENTPGTIAAVRGRSQPEHEQRRIERTQARHGPSPVFPVAEPTALHFGDSLGVLHEPGAPTAIDNGVKCLALRWSRC